MKNVNLLDVLVVILGSCTLALFLLWAGGQFVGITIFDNPPAYLQTIASNLFAVSTTGAIGSLLLIALRRQLSTQKAPPYLILIPIATLLLLATIVLLSKLIPQDRDQSRKNRISSSPLTIAGSDGKTEQYGTSYKIHSHFHNPDNLSVVRLRHVNDTPAAEQETCEQRYSKPAATKENEFPEIEECQASYFEVLEGGISVFRKAAYRTDFSGICRSTDGRTVLLFNLWNGSATTEGPLISVKYDPLLKKYKESTVFAQASLPAGDKEQESTLTSCKAGQQSFNLPDGIFSPCACTFEQAAVIRSIAEELFASQVIYQKDSFTPAKRAPFLDMAYEALPTQKYCRGRSVAFREIENYMPPPSISSTNLDSFLATIENLGPQMQGEPEQNRARANLNPFQIQRLNGEKYQITSVIYNEAGASWSAALYRSFDSGRWKVFHATKFGYKRLNPLQLIEHLGDDKFDVTMCIHSCTDHSAVFRRTTIDLRAMNLRMSQKSEYEGCPDYIRR